MKMTERRKCHGDRTACILGGYEHGAKNRPGLARRCRRALTARSGAGGQQARLGEDPLASRRTRSARPSAGVVGMALGKTGRPVRSALCCHMRRATASSYGGASSSQCVVRTKYLPDTPANSGRLARADDVPGTPGRGWTRLNGSVGETTTPGLLSGGAGGYLWRPSLCTAEGHVVGGPG
jgi:hypothetical protein